MITEHNIGKKSYIRKDGNKLGRKKESLQLMALATLSFEKAFEERNKSKHKSIFSGVHGLNTSLSGTLASGLKRCEMFAIGVGVFKDHHDDYHTSISHTIAMEAIERNNKICIVGSEVYHRDIIEKTVNLARCKFPEIIMVNDIPYNPMDEFDRPWMYDSNAEVARLVSEHHIPVVDNNYKHMYTTGNIFDQTKPYYLETELEEGIKVGKEWYKDLPGINLKKQELPLGKHSLEDLVEWVKKDSLFSMDKFNTLYYSNFSIPNLIQEVDKILKESNQEVIVLIKYGMPEYFKESDKNYKVIPINIGDIKISTEVANDIEAYTTQQEALLKLLDKIKGKREYVLEYHIAPGTGERLDIIKEITDNKEVIETKNLDEIKKILEERVKNDRS